MHSIRRAGWLLAMAGTLALAACDDDSISLNEAGCRDVSQSANQVEQRLATGKARVRVNVVSRLGVDIGSGEALRFSGVRLVQNGTCTSVGGSSTTRLGTVESDMGGMVADAALAPNEITALTLVPDGEQQGDRRLSATQLTLAKPIALQPGTRTEIFLALDSVKGSNQVAVRYVASGMVPIDATGIMVMEPGRGMHGTMRNGFSIQIPANAVTTPTVYGIQEYDVGGVTPMYNIMPRGALSSAGSITIPVDRDRIPGGMAIGDYGGSAAGAASEATVRGNLATFPISATGMTSMSSQRGYVQFDDGERVAVPGQGGSAARASLVNNTCSQRLSANRSYYLGQLAQKAGVRISECEGVSPYVHILILNVGYNRPTSTSVFPRVAVPGEWYTGTNTFLLHTITELANIVGAMAAVNGFTWTGDSGSDAGQTGTPNGTLYINGTRKSPAFSAAEALIAFQQGTSNGTLATLVDKPSGATPSLGTYNWNVIPSTTSIIKNGACSRTPGGEVAPWSSLGIGSGSTSGVVVMVSSVSGTSTDAYEICSVYEGLGLLGGAIRLDGNSAASIYWLGSHLNPLGGMSSLYYGSARHVAYGVAVVN